MTSVHLAGAASRREADPTAPSPESDGSRRSDPYAMLAFRCLLPVVFLCAASVPAQTPAAFDRTRPPVVSKPARLVVPTVRSAPLVNGSTVRVVEQHELPLVQVTAVIGGGSRLDGARPGIASFTANMLAQGAGSRDATALQSDLAYLGATLNASADWDRITVSLKVPLRSLEPALDLMRDVLLHPTFDAAELRRQRDLRLANLLQLRDQPNALADLAFNFILFPEGHPYHRSAQGDSASVAAFDSASIRAFYSSAVRPDRTTFIVVGDVTDAAARREIAGRFASWKVTAPAVAEPAETSQPVRLPHTRVYLVDKPNAAQSVIMIGWPGVDRRSPDYAALTVMNTLLGGAFTSRLNMNLREAKGYTYGARSAFVYRKSPGPFTASAAVRTNVTDSSLVEFFKELRAVRDTEVPVDELERAKAYVELGLPGSLESTTQIAGSIASLGVFGLGLDELPAFASRVRAVTAADVQRVAKQYLTPDQATVVVVGDLARVRASVEALNLGAAGVIEVKEITK